MKVGITYERTERAYEEFDVDSSEMEKLRNGEIPERMMTKIAEDLDMQSCDIVHDYCVTSTAGITMVDWGN